ncbi:GreA/GreB family elongation factor [Pseudomonas sp. gcc21]|uniref:GreA/GreB family elongation factor n=1 Tax=Pseudomonas sp. gcc21 TaxID=2726989 RepID=UPI0014525D7D|nr:GreA/GreB family elongation factor [Pseudomonas sp. gcc21]QJD58741.1 GreA/GreB family elongation factor [Pseudomonas sp. gcc21]
MTLHKYASPSPQSSFNHSIRWSMIGPRELAMVIGKLDQLDHDRPGSLQRKAQIGSQLKLLDMENDSFLEVELTGHGESDAGGGRISIFSPVGSVLLCSEPGQVVSLPSYCGGFRLLVVEVRQPPE